jgi:hypothetical protein
MAFDLDPGLIGRFWARVDRREPDECWLWLGGKTQAGYGVIGLTRSRRTMYVHRLAYELLVAPIPDGLTIDHVVARGCTSRACVNAPSHLEAVTIGVNILRGNGPTAREARMTECQRGHPFDEINTVWRKSGKRMCRECNRLRDRGAIHAI